MIINQGNLHGLDISYSTAYQKGFSSADTHYQKYATVVPSSTAETNYNWIGQMPRMREWIGEREVQNLSAYDYSIKNKHFEATIAVSRDEIEDDQYGVWTPVFESYGVVAAEHPDDLCVTALKNGFTEKCYDKQPFFAKSHKSGGKTFSNKTELKLSMAAYVQARSEMMSYTGDKGKPLGIVPNLLIVSPANEAIGREILEADQINGTTNVWKGTAELLVEPKLADHPDYWFLLEVKKPLKPIIYQKRKEIKLSSLIKDSDANVFNKNEYEWGLDGRSNAGYGFWQMAYGSDGTKSTEG